VKLYISCDMEGTAGVSVWRQCDFTNATEYPIYRRYMSQEVAAVIEGARSGGAGEFVVNDSHGSMVNLLWDELPPDVRVISGSRKPASMTEGLAAGFAGAIFTGYHAKAGDIDGVLAHTYVGSTIFDVTINGVSCSEALINAAMAGCYGVPVILVSGDEVLIDELRKQLPWIVGVAVKRGIGKFSSDSLSPQAAQRALREAAAEAMRNIGRAKPFTFTPPISMELTTTQVEHTDFIAGVPGIERTSGRTVRYRHESYPAVFQMLVTAYRLAVAAGAVA
jgi:D-amino peptidase